MDVCPKDVDEDYVVSVRVSRTKVVTLPPHEKRPPALVDQDCDAEELAEELQKVRVRWRPKQEKRKRHLKQILIRGDSVVMVSPVE